MANQLVPMPILDPQEEHITTTQQEGGQSEG